MSDTITALAEALASRVHQLAQEQTVCECTAAHEPLCRFCEAVRERLRPILEATIRDANSCGVAWGRTAAPSNADEDARVDEYYAWAGDQARMAREASRRQREDDCIHTEAQSGEGHCVDCDYLPVLSALRKQYEQTFEYLYGKVVGRISADIAGDFDAALDQLAFNAKEDGRVEATKAAQGRENELVGTLRAAMVRHRCFYKATGMVALPYENRDCPVCVAAAKAVGRKRSIE